MATGCACNSPTKPSVFTPPRSVLSYRRGERRAVVWRSDQTLMGRRGRPYTVMLLRSDRGTCRSECQPTVAAALDSARGWVTKSIVE